MENERLKRTLTEEVQESLAKGIDFVEDIYGTFLKMIDVSKYFRTYCYQSVENLGFSRNEIDVLLSLEQHPETNTVKGISEAVHLSKGMISQAVESLRKKKYVTVDHDEKDRRSVLITLSGIAQPVLEKLKEASSAFIQSIVNGIPAEQFKAVYQVVTQVHFNKEKMKTPDAQGVSSNMIGGACEATNGKI